MSGQPVKASLWSCLTPTPSTPEALEAARKGKAPLHPSPFTPLHHQQQAASNLPKCRLEELSCVACKDLACCFIGMLPEGGLPPEYGRRLSTQAPLKQIRYVAAETREPGRQAFAIIVHCNSCMKASSLLN